jgi:hypothetical protein
MSDKPAPTTIDIGSVSNARELVFTQGENNDHRYILQAKGSTEDYLSTLGRFPANSIRTTREHYIDDTEGEWFACYNVDCFDPPFAVIRARSFEQAYEVFCDEFSRWFAVDEKDADDYPEDERNYNSSGVHIDTDNLQIHPLTLLSILL